jgi:hypothetical protein
MRTSAVAVLALLFLVSPAAAAVGDLAGKAVDPAGSGGIFLTMVGQDSVKPAPAGAGTIHPDARLVTLRDARNPTGLSATVALDATKSDAKVLGVLRLDLAATGKFASDASVDIKWPNADGVGSASFGPVSAQLKLGDKLVPATVRGYVTAAQGNRLTTLYLVVGTCLEGECAFGDQVRLIRFVDTDGNGHMNDKAKVEVVDGKPRGIGRGDGMFLASADGYLAVGSASAASYGQAVVVGGKWYDVAVSADERKVTATLRKDALGKLKVDADKWEALLLSTGGIFGVQGGKDPVDIPVGKYAVYQATVGKGKASVTIADNDLARGTSSMVEIVAGKTAEKAFGAPFVASILIQQQGQAVSLTPDIRDAGGRKVFAVVNPAGSEGNLIEVRDGTGKVLLSAAMVFS